MIRAPRDIDLKHLPEQLFCVLVSVFLVVCTIGLVLVGVLAAASLVKVICAVIASI